MRPLAGQVTDFRAVILPNEGTEQRLQGILGSGFELTSRLPFVISVADGSIGGDDAMIFTAEKRYSEASLAAHLVGYTDSSGSGAVGIERAYNDFLSQNSGALRMTCTINAVGTVLSGIEPVITDTTDLSHAGVVLTLDADIQLAVERAMQGRRGAAVVMNTDGEILASVSSPTFSQNDIAASLSSPDSPLYNRTFAAYDLGSVFKLVTAAAALESGIGADFVHECTGSVQIGDNIFHCSNRGGHGELDMCAATACSCNTYFIALANETGSAAMLDMAQKLGFGRSLQLADNLATQSGSLPDIDELMRPAALANFSFGQGSLMATPMHIASLVCTIASGGTLHPPRAVIGLADSNLEMTSYYTGPRAERVLSEETCTLLRSFMRESVVSGTAKNGEGENVRCAAKTGTAQTGITGENGTLLQAWYAGFFPYDNPEYICVVVIEGGTSGGADAGPIFKEIADTIT